MFGHDPFGILAYAVNPADAATGPLGSGLASAGATASAATTKAVTQPAAARAGATGRAFSLKAITSPAATQIGQSGAVTTAQPVGITYQARASSGARASALSVQGPATAVTGQIFWGNAWQAQPDWRKRLQDNRVALGLVPAPKPVSTGKVRKGSETAKITMPPMPDAGAALAFVRAKLAENNALQAEAAAKATRARAVVTRERQEARQAELSAQIAAIEILETVIQQEIEETDVAFVAMLLMEGTE